MGNMLKSVEDLTIRATRITHRRSRRTTITAPPVLATIIEEDPLTRLDASLTTLRLTANIS